ncbi:Phosphoserine aminotransferase, partial [Perkinsus olseni]
IYASGGKNLGPAGVCLAIVREDLIRPSSPPYVCPSFIDFHIQSTSTPLCSLYNTPPTFAIYMVNLVLGYYQKAYGPSDTLANVQKKAIRRAAQVWGTVDRSNGFYTVISATVHLRRLPTVCFGSVSMVVQVAFLRYVQQYVLRARFAPLIAAACRSV